MPSLDRLKGKVEKALNGPKTSFKDFLEKTKNSIGSKIFINGQEIESLTLEAQEKAFATEIKEIEAILAPIYWCKQDAFAKELSQAKDILSLLKEKFKEKYPVGTSPLMTFAKDIAQENETLELVKNKITKSMPSVKKFKEIEKKYTELAQKIVLYSQTINSLIKTTNSL